MGGETYGDSPDERDEGKATWFKPVSGFLFEWIFYLFMIGSLQFDCLNIFFFVIVLFILGMSEVGVANLSFH